MHCPICRYNLRGLSPAALCPECGSTPEQRAAALAKRPRFLIPSIFAVSTAIAVVALLLMDRSTPTLIEVLIVLAINSIPLLFAWAILAVFARPTTRIEAVLGALPPALIVLAVLCFAYYDALVRNSDAQNGIVILFSPVFTVPLSLIACLLSFLFLTIKRNRTATQRSDRH